MKKLIVAIALLSSLSCWATPAEVLIIRHAEKPATGNDLDAAGEARAQALVNFFQTDPRMLDFGTPVAIYAAAPAGKGGSMRPIETVTPLAQALGLTLITAFDHMDTSGAAQAVLSDPSYEGKTVLLCWEHGVIPQLAASLGVSPTPDAWPDPVFDRVWKITYNGDTVSSFQNLPQHLMPGDSAN